MKNNLLTSAERAKFVKWCEVEVTKLLRLNSSLIDEQRLYAARLVRQKLEACERVRDLLLYGSQEMDVSEKDASQWRDDDCPQAENTFGVRKVDFYFF